MKSKEVSAIIQAKAGDRLVFGLLHPDNDGVFQLEFGFLKPNGQSVEDLVWQPIKVGGERVNLDTNNYPLYFDVQATGSYRLRNMAGDDTQAVPVLIEQYQVRKYVTTEMAL